MEIKYPDITVQLTGQNGNIFNLMGLVNRQLRGARINEKIINDFSEEVFDSKSYNEALQIIMKWVNVT